jgi:hypothetical protein
MRAIRLIIATASRPWFFSDFEKIVASLALLEVGEEIIGTDSLLETAALTENQLSGIMAA